MFTSTLLWSCLCTATLAAQADGAVEPIRASAPDPVIVQADDGRVLQGEVDARTDKDRLWLRLTGQRIAVSSSIRWDRVRSARYRDHALSVAELAALAVQLKSELPDDFFSRNPPAHPEASESAPQRMTASEPSPPRSTFLHGKPEAPSRRKVQSLRIEAALANWDGDVEVDGLEIRVSPLAADGTIVPADGMLSVRLIGRRVRGRAGERIFVELDRWSRRVRASDCGPWGSVYRLPFRRVHPEFDLDFAIEGLVHGQLGVPGQGNFEASVPAQIRTYAPIREDLQLLRQKRFFPRERTGWPAR